MITQVLREPGTVHNIPATVFSQFNREVLNMLFSHCPETLLEERRQACMRESIKLHNSQASCSINRKFPVIFDAAFYAHGTMFSERRIGVQFQLRFSYRIL